MARQFWCLVVVVLLAACGGGSSTSTTADPASSPTTAGESPDTTGAEPTGSTQDAGSGGGSAGEGSVTYTVSGSIEDSGEQPFVPAMSFYDGFWTMTFGGEASLIIISLDPATPSVNYTNGGNSVGGAAECEFDITRQDESGAEGSFDCPDAPAIVAGALDTASISGSFSAP